VLPQIECAYVATFLAFTEFDAQLLLVLAPAQFIAQLTFGTGPAIAHFPLKPALEIYADFHAAGGGILDIRYEFT